MILKTEPHGACEKVVVLRRAPFSYRATSFYICVYKKVVLRTSQKVVVLRIAPFRQPASVYM